MDDLTRLLAPTNHLLNPDEAKEANVLDTQTLTQTLTAYTSEQVDAMTDDARQQGITQGRAAREHDLREELIDWHKNYGLLDMSDFNELLAHLDLEEYKPIQRVRVTVEVELDVDDLALADEDDFDVEAVCVRASNRHGEAENTSWDFQVVSREAVSV